MPADGDGVNCRQFPLHDWCSYKFLELGGQNDGLGHCTYKCTLVFLTEDKASRYPLGNKSR